MIININIYSRESYEFAFKYLSKYKGNIFEIQYIRFSFELNGPTHDNTNFDIDPVVFNWPHLMIAEKYVENNGPRYQSDLSDEFERKSLIHQFLGELGGKTSRNPYNDDPALFNNPKKRKTSGGKQKHRDRTRRRGRGNRRTRHLSKKS